MKKLIYLLWKPQDQTAEVFRDHLLASIPQELASLGASNIRLSVCDKEVSAAHKKRMVSALLSSSISAPDALLGLWLDNTRHHPIEKILNKYSKAMCGYEVSENEPLVNTQYPVQRGERTPGMNQVVLLRIPSRLTRSEWLDLWLKQHTPIAIETQSTFGYRQNIVVRALTDNALTKTLAIDAIVEENFPSAAMTSAHAFYKAIDNNGKGDDALLRKNQAVMFASVQRFIDLDKLDCLPMSEYHL
jgi:hypothetical protein